MTEEQVIPNDPNSPPWTGDPNAPNAPNAPSPNAPPRAGQAGVGGVDQTAGTPASPYEGPGYQGDTGGVNRDGSDEQDDVASASQDSFPASDPPPFNPGHP